MNAEELLELRRRFNWSQEEAAARLGCSKRSIANWEKGTHKIPDSIALAASAVCMNLPKYGKTNSQPKGE
jgi:transcriptional regulator with XRE-family HTH domain